MRKRFTTFPCLDARRASVGTPSFNLDPLRRKAKADCVFDDFCLPCALLVGASTLPERPGAELGKEA